MLMLPGIKAQCLAPKHVSLLDDDGFPRKGITLFLE